MNIDLIAGMLGDTDEKWHAAVARTIELSPDSVTIYQMELPYNTTISSDLLKGAGQFADTVADWPTKRRWVREAFEALEQAGYTVGSAYTAVKNPETTHFVYRDQLWQGADLAALGVASFGHINGVHMQNLDSWGPYAAAVQRGEIPLNRGFRPTDRERLIREFVLQLKLGSVRPSYFQDKYGVDVLERFADALTSLRRDGYLLAADAGQITLTREGLLRVDILFTPVLPTRARRSPVHLETAQEGIEETGNSRPVRRSLGDSGWASPRSAAPCPVPNDYDDPHRSQDARNAADTPGLEPRHPSTRSMSCIAGLASRYPPRRSWRPTRFRCRTVRCWCTRTT